EFLIEPAFRYFSEQSLPPAKIRTRIRCALEALVRGDDARDRIVWMHNPGVDRNLLLTGELTRACKRHAVPLILHHHDWWFENRWSRWPEMRRCGFRTLQEIARATFPTASSIHHAAINQLDAGKLKSHMGRQAAWLPNLGERGKRPSASRAKAARLWMQG